MKLLLTLCLLGGWAPVAFTAASLPATASNSPPAAPDGSRFLFVVDTSSSMRRLEEANRQALFDMIFTGLNGHMRTGDTFGLWTFNEDTFVGQFPMQVWDAENPMDTASRAAMFLRGQKYAGESHPEVLMPKLRSVARAVGDVNVFILSDGKARLELLPFGDAINTEYQKRSKERARANKPFVTTLVAHKGKMVAANVTIAGQPLTLPERSIPRMVSAGKASSSPATNILPARLLAGAPLAPSDQQRLPEPPPVESALSNAQATSVRPAIVPAPRTNESSAIGPATSPNAVTAAAPPELSPISAMPSNSTLPKLTAAVAAETKPAPLESAQSDNALAPPKKVIRFITKTNQITFADNSNSPPALPDATLPPTPVVSTVASKTEEVIIPSRPSAQPKPAAPMVAADPAPSSPFAAWPAPTPVAARELASERPPATPAVTTTPGLGAGALLGLGCALLASAIFLVVVVLRRLRPPAQASFITQSMERR